MRVLAALALALSVVACNGDDVTSPDVNVVPVSILGTWQLESVDGLPLPLLLDQLGEDKIELMEAAVTATTNSTFRSTSVERTTIAGQATSQSYAEEGTYAINGSRVSFTFTSDGSVVNGVVDGNQLRFSETGIVVVYRRK